MNIFALHEDPSKAAQMHCDKHVVKMVLETAQILSTVHHLHGSPNIDSVYKPTHKNHPSVKWAAEWRSNYQWLYWLFYFLSDEYRLRFCREHKSWEKLRLPLEVIPESVPGNLYEGSPFALAMPDVYKFVSDDPVECYRAYYWHEKRDLLKYTKRSEPEWLAEMRAQDS